MANKECSSPSEAAEYLGVSRPTLYKLPDMSFAGHGNTRFLLLRRAGELWKRKPGSIFIWLFLFVAALAIRIPYLQLIPPYWDEGSEVIWALDIALGRRLPLAAADAYHGPLFFYLTAGLFRLLGIDIAIPRVMVTVFGALLVIVVYWLAKSMWDDLTGLLAAGLTATNPALVIISSHYGWSNSLTPFFTALTILALYLGVDRHKDWLVACSGILAALMLQTHPITLVVLPALLLWFLMRRDILRWLKRPAPYVALMLFLLAYSPMLLPNLRQDSPMLRQALLRTYAFSIVQSPDEYWGRLQELAQSLGSSLWWSNDLLSGLPILPIVGVSSFFGLVLASRRGNSLLMITFFSSLLLLPIFLKIYMLRYITFLDPIALIGLAGLMSDCFMSVRTALIRRLRTLSAFASAGLTLVLLLYAGFIASQLVAISAYYSTMVAQGKTNEDFINLREKLISSGACAGRVFLADDPSRLGLPNDDHEWGSFQAIRYVLTMAHCEFHSSALPQRISESLAQSGGAGWLIASSKAEAVFSKSLQMKRSDISPGVHTSTVIPLAVYEVTPLWSTANIQK